MKICAHQIAKRWGIAKKRERALPGREKILYNIVFFERPPRRLLIFVIKVLRTVLLRLNAIECYCFIIILPKNTKYTY